MNIKTSDNEPVLVSRHAVEGGDDSRDHDQSAGGAQRGQWRGRPLAARSMARVSRRRLVDGRGLARRRRPGVLLAAPT